MSVAIGVDGTPLAQFRDVLRQSVGRSASGISIPAIPGSANASANAPPQRKGNEMSDFSEVEARSILRASETFSATELAEACRSAAKVLTYDNKPSRELESAARFIEASAEGLGEIAEMAPSVEAERMGNGPYLGCAMLEIATQILTTYLRR